MQIASIRDPGVARGAAVLVQRPAACAGPPNKALKRTALLVTLLARRKKRAKPVGPRSPTGQGGRLAWTLGGPRFSREGGWRRNHDTGQQIMSSARIGPIKKRLIPVPVNR